jgi:hypothetical protein
MKKLFTILLAMLFVSCTETRYTYIGQEIIDGKVSATTEGKTASYGSPAYLPKIWVQNATNTKEVDIPFEYEGRWKVGDSCLLIIKKYKENDTE